jgi:hypothetical protein
LRRLNLVSGEAPEGDQDQGYSSGQEDYRDRLVCSAIQADLTETG